MRTEQNLIVGLFWSCRVSGCGGWRPGGRPAGGLGRLAPAGPADGYGEAVNRLNWRSCTFFLQTAISKRRDHADLPIGLGLGTGMNVQRRPRCTFILLTSASRGGKTLE